MYLKLQIAVDNAVLAVGSYKGMRVCERQWNIHGIKKVGTQCNV
jgi:hypothetical protein